MTERVASVDAAWLRMEQPTNLMMITAVLWFDEPPDRARLKAVLAERLVERFPRFRQRLVLSGGLLETPYWEDDPAFDLDVHLGQVAIPPPGDRRALEALVSRWMSTSLDRSRPLWQLHLVDDLEQGGALLVRIHHALADGICLARVLLSLMSDSTAEHLRPEQWARPGPLAPGWLRLLRGARALTAGTRTALAQGAELLREPVQARERAREWAGAATTLARLTLTRSDPPMALRGELGTAKLAAWADPIPLDHVKAIGHAMDGTINDVLLAALTGALRRYLEERGGPAENLHAFIPVNLRPLDAPIPRELGNRFGLVFLDLPVEEADPRQRLRLLKQRMDELKRSPEAVLTFVTLRVMGLAPGALERAAVNALAAKGTLVMTNVPGPRQPVYLAGTKLAGLMFWAPQTGKVGLSVSIFSYAGKVTVGVSADAGLVPDPHRLLIAFQDELDALASAAAPARPRSSRTGGDTKSGPKP